MIVSVSPLSRFFEISPLPASQTGRAFFQLCGDQTRVFASRIGVRQQTVDREDLLGIPFFLGLQLLRSARPRPLSLGGSCCFSRSSVVLMYPRMAAAVASTAMLANRMRAAAAGRRRTHFTARSRCVAGRARIGRSASQRSRSSASASAEW